MTIANATAVEERALPFKASVAWDSFNELAKEVGSAGLRELEPGTLARLRVKHDSFVLAREEDFQMLVGLAADAARLEQMVKTLVEGIDLANQHADARTLGWIRDVATQIMSTLPGTSVTMDLLAGLDDEDDDEPPRARQRPALAISG